MTDQNHTEDLSAAGSGSDAEAAIRAAEQMVQDAQAIAEAVANYHSAMADLRDAEQRRAEASDRRVSALRQMHSAGLGPTRMSELTGISTSRITTLIG